MTREAAEANPDSLLNKVKEDFGEWNAQIAFVAMKQGDKVAAQVVDSYTDYLADGLANAINAFMPEILVVGGGVCNEGDPLLIPMREKTMSRPYFGPGVAKTRIELAQMGNDAGIVGAAMMGKSCVDDGKNGK
jgi:glucokinase